MACMEHVLKQQDTIDSRMVGLYTRCTSAVDVIDDGLVDMIFFVFVFILVFHNHFIFVEYRCRKPTQK